MLICQENQKNIIVFFFYTQCVECFLLTMGLWRLTQNPYKPMVNSFKQMHLDNM